jgi:S1-C subfamily serine protease
MAVKNPPGGEPTAPVPVTPPFDAATDPLADVPPARPPDEGPAQMAARQHKPPRAARPSRWRGRILPKSILGISALILAFSIGASLSGVVLYAYYSYRLGQTNDHVNSFSDSVKTAQASIKAQEDAAKAEIQRELDPIQKIAAEGDTLQALVSKAAGALYFVHTLDEAGQPSVGTAFSVASDSHQTLLLTSYTTVQAATKRPGPDVFVRKGTNDIKVTVYTWQEERDLALIILPTGNQPKLTFATETPTVGERVFALSGLGAQGGAATQGFIADVSSAGIQHDAAIGPAFQGGPLVNSDGQVLGISSRAYSPLGFSTDSVWFAIPSKAACEKVLSCPGNTPTAAGAPPTG